MIRSPEKPEIDTPGVLETTLSGATVFLSAFLLFQVQPMIAKIILPWFGGSAAVWTTCLCFFQVGLLLGYLYSHAVTRYLSRRRTLLAHYGLLILSLLTLPVVPNAALKPLSAENPTLRILVLLTSVIGLPYFLLSSTGPLIQSWVARAWTGSVPYRLYALSNAGSMLALLSYPTLLEPWLGVGVQTRVWSMCFAVFTLLSAATAWVTRNTASPSIPADYRAMERPLRGVRILWLLLSACSSLLLLAVTNHLTQNVAPVPFLWVLPLSVYLATFIICFERERWYDRRIFLPLGALGLAAMACVMSGERENLAIKIAVPMFNAGLFACCMMCHGELARLKPHPRFLTSFYLTIAVGGALGGTFVAVAAPYLFNMFLEMHVGLVLCAAVILAVLWRDTPAKWRSLWFTGAAGTLVMAGWLAMQVRLLASDYLLMVRSFYGGLRVYEDNDPEDFLYQRGLTHGTISHGAQYLQPYRSNLPTTYFGPNSGAGLAVMNAGRSGPQRVGVIGLGVGVMAAYSRSGDYYRFYEIDPLVIHLAQTQFTFLKDSKAKVDVVLGDARLSLEREPSQNFDLLAVDAFSSDSVPVHLLTKEALALYFRHMKSSGVLCVQVSNRYLDLSPVVDLSAKAIGKQALLIEDHSDEEFSSTSYVLVTGDALFFERPIFRERGIVPHSRTGLRTWTDDYSNLFRILK